MGTLNIAANNGTKKNGFGWDMIGLGMNTGGTWEWQHDGTNFSIFLTENQKGDLFPFGHVVADWSSLSSSNGHPPEPWFSESGVNSGTLEVINFSTKKFILRLRK